MSLQNRQNTAVNDQVRKACEGDPEALAALREQWHPLLVNIWQARGASSIETEDILADLWSDCVSRTGDKPSLLTKFGGKFSILSWLARVSYNRWIDQKRRGSRQTNLENSDIDAMPGCQVELEDDNLQVMLRESLRSAFAICASEPMILLHLVYLHGLTQREAGNLFGWTETKTSRSLSQAMVQIRTQTLAELKRRDPRFELSWEDLIGLCADEETPFL